MSATFRVALAGQTVPFRFSTVSFAGIRELVAADVEQDISARAAKAQNGADFVDVDAVLDNLTITPTGTGAVALPLSTLLAYGPQNVRSYGATGNGSTDDTLAFQRAFAANLGKPIFVPPGTYRVGNVGGLTSAGSGMFGAAGYTTVIKPVAGTTGSLFYNPNAATNNFVYGVIRDLRFDLNGEDCIAIDLSHCDTCVVERVNGQGGNGSTLANAGTLVKFGAPTDSSSYNNVVRDCAGSYFATAIIFGLNANQNRVEGGSYVLNDTAIDCDPGGVLLRPTVLGARIEGNSTGIKEGAQGGVYLGYFEDNASGAFVFSAHSADAIILPGTTTASETALVTPDLATNLRSLSFDVGFRETTNSTSRPALVQRREIRSRPGGTLSPTVPNADMAMFFGDMLVLGNGIGIEGAKADNSQTVLVLQVDSNNELVLRSYDRGLAADRPVNIGAGDSVRPLTNNGVDLGTGARRWKDGYFGGNVFANGALSLEGAGSLVYINGVQVMKSRRTGWATATGTATRTTFDTSTVTLPQLAERVKALIDDLHSDDGHGQIGP